MGLMPTASHNTVDLDNGRSASASTRVDKGGDQHHLEIMQKGSDGHTKTYGIKADGTVMSGGDFSTPANPKALLRDAQKILTNPAFAKGEAEHAGFSDQAKSNMLLGIEKGLSFNPRFGNTLKN